MKMFRTMFTGFDFPGEDLSRKFEPIFEELAPYAVDVNTGEILNPTSEPMVVKVGEIDVNEKINSYRDDVDIYKILEKFATTGDVAYINRSVGNFGDVVAIPDNINDFAKYVDDNIAKLKDLDPKLASGVIKDNISDSDLQALIEESVKSAMIKANMVSDVVKEENNE